jgi:translation initiation factor IF-1
MVKNSKGGKHKNFARKSINSNGAIRFPQEEGECFAIVEKMLGNCMCDVNVLLPDGNTTHAICNIRGKFRAHNKNHNLVYTNAKIIIGLRQWDLDILTHNSLKCDLLHLFLEHDLPAILHARPDTNAIFNI